MEPLYEEFPEWLDENPNSMESVPNLRIHLFGPYRGEYENILRSIAEYLREESDIPNAEFDICADIPSHKHGTGDMVKSEKNWWESVYCLKEADAAIFLFLEDMDSRLQGAPRQGLNSSVVAELTFWSVFFSKEKLGTYVLFEGDASNMGSLIEGLINVGDLESNIVESGELDEIKEKCLTTCINWVSK